MTNSFSLDDIRKAADAKYGSTEIKVSEDCTVVLLNPLRLPKERRDALSEISDRMQADDADQAAILADALRAASKGSKAVETLIGQIDGDLAVLMELFDNYMEGTQAGEASASES